MNKTIVMGLFLFVSISSAQWVNTGAKFKNYPYKSQEYGLYWDENEREVPRFRKRDLDYDKMLGELEEREYYNRQYKSKKRR